MFKTMPLRTQQVLRRDRLTPVNLLDLPNIPMDTSHWLNYIDIIAHMAEGAWKPSFALGPPRASGYGRLPKIKVADYQLGSSAVNASHFSTYAGSSRNRRGGPLRVYRHLSEAAKPHRHGEPAHYQEARNPGAVMNFRLINIADNSLLSVANVASQKPPASLTAAGPQLDIIAVEGFVILFLGLSIGVPNPDYNPESVIEFQRQLRDGLDLPDFSQFALNRADVTLAPLKAEERI
ncbi:hypothetical protein PG996_010122 [Apiospora saccharicola]|uniref:Uncharacterized protein n=1 Tax=Apiospora saccharicola TaxID=335842 RepID=A0ABR1UMR6_9PEZI